MTHRRLFVSLLAGLILASAPRFLHADETVELKRHWEVGKKFYRTSKNEKSFSMKYGEVSIAQTSQTTYETSSTVTASADGKSKRVSTQYNRVAMDVTTNGKKISFDSSASDPEKKMDPAFETLSKLSKRQLNYLVSNQDEILSVEPMDIFSKDEKRKPVVSMESLVELVKQSSLHSMPDHPVKPGDTWPFVTSIDVPRLGKLEMNGAYTLKRIADYDGVRCAEIAVDIKFDLEASKAEDAEPGAKAINKLGAYLEYASAKGTIWFDPKLGMNRSSHITTELTMAFKDPKEAKTISMPMKLTSDAHLTKVEDIKK